MSVELVYMSSENGVVCTVGSVGWFSESETLVSDTTTDGVCRSRDCDDGSCGTIHGSCECEGIYGTSGINRGDTCWTSGTGSS